MTYHALWAEQQFGSKYAKEIGDILQKYGQYSSRRKPELLSHDTYSYAAGEWDRVIHQDFTPLRKRAEKINALLPAADRDAFFQLVLHPIQALDNLHHMYYMVALNQFYANQKNALANRYADSVKFYYIRDSIITKAYHQLGGGKWNHMMSQTHIGYTYWQQPLAQKMPTVSLVGRDMAVTQNVTIATGATQTPIVKGLVGQEKQLTAFGKYDSSISIEAAHFSRAIGNGNISWKVIPGIGRTDAGVTMWPVTAAAQQATPSGPHLEYYVYPGDTGSFTIRAFFSPSLNYHNTETGLQYAIAIDEEAPQVISVNKEDNSVRTWERWVANNIIIKTSNHRFTTPGRHTVKCWLIHPGLVLQKLVLDFGTTDKTYLGPQETKLQ